MKQWDKRFGGNGGDQLTSFKQTTDGGYILGGYSNSGINGDKTQLLWDTCFTCIYRSDYWIVKIDSLGIKQWDKRFGGKKFEELSSLQQTTDGGYILGGLSQSGISGDKTQSVLGYFDYWIVKTDSLGIKQWDKRFGGTSGDRLTSLEQTTDGGYILGGFTSSTIGGDKTQPSWGYNDFWIVKVDSLGIKQWDKRFGGLDDDYLYSLQQTKDGGYILGGYSESGIGGDKTQSNWSGLYDYWIVKIDSLGIKQWDKRFGGTFQDLLHAVYQTTDGGYLLEGTTDSGISGDRTQPLWGGSDYWIVKIDSLGIKQWDKRFGGFDYDEGVGNIFQTNDFGYLISGTSYSNLSGDKTENNLGIEQTWIVKIDSLGNKQWDETLHTNNIIDDEVGLAIQTKDGCYAFANYTDAGIGGDKTQTSRVGFDYWIIKFCDTTLSLIPSINLSSSQTSFCEKNCINFFDLSTNNPTSWQWFFPGAQPDTSSLQDPTNICYNAYGSFDVTLIACNTSGCDTLVLHNFINEYPNPVDSIYGLNDTLFSLPAISYQWYSTTGIIAGATNQYFVPTQLGNYFCLVSDSIGCVATSNTIIITAVQSEIYNSQFAISPNPFTNLLTITLKNKLPSEITLYDITSRKLLQQTFTNSASINTQQLAKGIYFYEVKCMEQVIGKGKVVKE